MYMKSVCDEPAKVYFFIENKDIIVSAFEGGVCDAITKANLGL